MPIFEIEGPDGIYEVDAPDENAAVAGFRQAIGGQEPAADPRDSFLGKVDTAMRGAADTLSLGFADEISAGLGTGFGFLGDYDAELARQRGIDTADAENRFGYRLGGQLAGGVAGGAGLARAGLSPTAGAIQAGWRLPYVAGAGAAEGLALGGIHGFGSGEGLDNRLAQAESGAKLGAVGGAAAPVAVAGIVGAGRRAITPFATSPERVAAANTLAREGVPLTAGQRTGNKSLQFAEMEIGGARAAQMMEDQNRAFTRAAMRRAGQDTLADPDSLAALDRRLSQGFTDISARNSLRADQGLASDFNATMQEYGRLLPSEQRRIIGDISQELVDRFRAGGGTISGRDYQTWRSRFSKAAQSARGNDNNLADAWRGLRNALDNAMERSINPADAGAWRELRRQWGNKRTLENAIASAGGEDAGMGIISPARLRMAASAGKNRGQYARGQNDFSELAHAGQATMTPLPNSGTAARLSARSLGMMAPTIVGAGYGGMTGGDLQSAMAGAAAGYALQRGAGATLMSRPVQRYLSNQAATGELSPMARAIATAILTGETGALAGRLSSP